MFNCVFNITGCTSIIACCSIFSVDKYVGVVDVCFVYERYVNLISCEKCENVSR